MTMLKRLQRRSGPDRRDTDLGKICTGLADVMFAFSLALERKGLLSRTEIAEVLAAVITGAIAQEGGKTDRVVIAELMLQAFSAPIAGADARSRLQVLAGGRESPVAGEDQHSSSDRNNDRQR